MANIVKMCDLSASLASFIFKSLNKGKIELVFDECGNRYIVTDVKPLLLTYPEGWYYAKGNFRNKHTSSTGIYEEIPMVKSNGDCWVRTEKYSTLN